MSATETLGGFRIAFKQGTDAAAPTNPPAAGLPATASTPGA